MQKLRDLAPHNSKGELCIERFLMKSEKAFFEEVKKEKISGEWDTKGLGPAEVSSDERSVVARFVHPVPRGEHD